MRSMLSLLTLTLAACSTTPRITADSSTDASFDATSDGGACASGAWSCLPGDRAQPCGAAAEPVNCAASGQVCAAGRGCVACRPGEHRCKPDEPNTTQTCAADASGWIDGASCNTANSERCVDGVCTNPCANLGDSYLGCEYWPTVTANGGLQSEFEFAIVLASTQSYPISVRIEGGGLAASRTITVAPNGTEVVRLPWVSALSNNQSHCCSGVFDTGPNCTARSARVANGAFHVVSDAPVAVYQFNPLEYRRAARFSFTNDASLLLPQNVLGTQHIAMSWVSEGNPLSAPTDRCFATGLRGGYVTIVGAQASGANTLTVRTTATIWSPSNPTQTLPPGTHTFSIERGEVLQLVSSGLNADLTGTQVDSTAPVAVFSGHECGDVPTTRAACDHLEEQMFPLATWGRTVAVSPVRYRSDPEPSTIRIVAQRDGVTLSFDGIARPASCARTLQRGQFCEFETSAGFTVSGNLPILVGQYLRGLGEPPECQCAGQTCPDLPQCVGDPAMVLEPPVDQFRASYRFLVPSTYTANFVNVVVPMGADLDLDGSPLVGAIDTDVGAGFVARTVNITPGAHSIRAVDGRTRFGIKVWGVAPYTSYAYPGGLDLAPIAPP
ncbi:MAG: IgGFc-binding protein [Polyangiales bacterium]